MDNKLYRLMNWPEIESVVYSECDHPENILGEKQVNGGYLIQCFYPGAESVSVFNFHTEKEILMERVDEEGFFAAFIPSKTPISYEYIVKYENDEAVRKPEVYKYIPMFWTNLQEKLEGGIFYDSYRYFGAHFVERKGILGVEFLCYAPSALRVSVVGDFNNWDGRINQMCKISDAGVFGLFIPGVQTGSLYKFEIKLQSGLTFLKRDPFALSIEKGKGDASRIIEEPEWEMVKYKRKPLDSKFSLLNISLKDFCKEGLKTEEAAEKIINALSSGFNGVLFNDLSFCEGKDVTGYGKLSFYAVDPDILRLKEIVKIVDLLHEKGIRVFSTIDASAFLPDNGGLRGFDGTKLYEGENKEIDGLLSFDFNKAYIRNYIISACDYFVKILSLDGLCIDGLDRILYLDFGIFDGSYIPNMYGGNENVNGFELIKHLNSILHKRYSNLITIAAGSLSSNNLTDSLEDNGLGFDYKLHAQFDKDLFEYLSADFDKRSELHSVLTYSPVYIYCERFILSFLNKDYGNKITDLYKLLPGSESEKQAQVRLLISYTYLHPGRKCLNLIDEGPEILALLKALNCMYAGPDSENFEDDSEASFKWVNAIDSKHSVISFIRKSKNKEILVVANFKNVEQSINIGVEKGTYKESFSSSLIKFGGSDKIVGRPKQSRPLKADGKKDALSVKIAPLTLLIFEKYS